jgi:N-methylhydantoinase B/oxoprolinase/acetone carboxylase alpha subunit
MATIDPITLSSVWYYTQRVCDEMQYILERTAWVEIICTKANC